MGKEMQIHLKEKKWRGKYNHFHHAVEKNN